MLDTEMGTRTLTIVFTDIVRSTELLSGLGDREADRVLQSHFADLGEQIAHFGGAEVKRLGDGVMARFEAAGDAVDCGVAMQQAVSRAAPVGDRSISIRVGISSGDVQVEQADCHGIAVVEASRLCDAADGGQVLFSQATQLLARRGAQSRSLGMFALKGLPQPIEGWEAEWAAEEAGRIRVLLADDAVLVREGIAQVLERAGLEVVGQAGDAEEVVHLAAALRPHVAVVDVRMPPTNTAEGLEAAEGMRAEDPSLGVLVLSQEVDSHSARRLLALGQEGLGYLLKERVTNVRAFADAVRQVAAGGTAFEAAVISSLVGGGPTEGGIRQLSADEREALAALDRVAASSPPEEDG
jgi:class 3 adenylate cyclase/DNA-binding NarL/FixJ family response regulator